jgi:hypothetical protein
MNLNNSADDNCFPERAVLETLGVGIWKIVQLTLQEKKARQSEIVGLMRTRLEDVVLACNVSATRIASWREQAKQQLATPPVPEPVEKVKEPHKQEVVTA